MRAAVRWAWSPWILLGWMLLPAALRAADLLMAFDQANRLYEEGQFTNAAAAYQKVISGGHGSATLYFNLGNAWFKAGQLGRAIAAYRHAERLAPRDPYVRFNLQFARKKVTGSDTVNQQVWDRFISALALNEWSVLALAGWWAWFALLSLREFRPAFRRTLRGYTATVGAIALGLCACLGAALFEQTGPRAAVVVVPNAVVRRGPLEESQVSCQLRDGSEVSVLDQKKVSAQESWLQVRDDAGRVGWVKRDQVVVVQPGGVGRK